MKSRIFLIVQISIFLFAFAANAQNVSISTDNTPPDNSAMLDIKSNNRGLLIPRVVLQNLANAAPITTPVAVGLMVYNESNANGVAIGFYSWAGTQWNKLLTMSDLPDNSATNELQTLTKTGNNLTLSQNGGTVDLSSYLDNTDNQQLSISNKTISLTNGGSVDLATVVQQDYALLKMSNSQTTGIGTDLPVKFDIIEGNLSLNGVGRFTLKSGKIYKLISNIRVHGTSDLLFGTKFYNVTQSQYFGSNAMATSLTQSSSQPSAAAIIIATTNIDVELRINYNYLNHVFEIAADSYILIEEIK